MKRLEIAALGDLHGAFDAALDAPLLERFPLALCTGDLTPNHGRDRFDVALRIARELAGLRVRTILGNHDGPTGFTGRSFPASYLALCEILGDFNAGARLIELPELELSLVGARPLSMGGPTVKFVAPPHDGWSIQRWGDEIAALIAQASQPRIVVLAHSGPTGLGAQRDAPFGCDFRPEGGDWGDPDLRFALERARTDGRPVVAVVAGHMHHALSGGGMRVRSMRVGGTLHVNAAIVPRVTPRGRALVVLELDGLEASASIEWHAPDGSVEREALD